MPRGDGTGPNGQGSMTGRRMGFCAGFNAPGFTSNNRGRGFGWRARTAQVTPIQKQVVITEKQEKQFLEQELNALKQEMKEIEKRLKEIKE